MRMRNSLAYRLALIATILAFISMAIGTYTHLYGTDLACHGWPTCYNQAQSDLSKNIRYNLKSPEKTAVNMHQAWQEMIHRYIAGAVVVLILILAILAFHHRRLSNQPIVLPFVLVGLVLIQALLGKWVITQQLQTLLVIAHLVIGIAILILLWLLTLRLR